MINRTLIRLKIVQILYSYYQNGGKIVETVEKELMFSLTKAHDLYNYLLLLMVDVTRMADEIINEQEERNKIAHIDTEISHRFLDNKFIAQLASNTQLMDFVDTKKLTWSDDRDFLKKLYATITESVYYAEYMMKESVDYADDRELWRNIYKHIIMKMDAVDEILEEKSIYWNDDKQTIDTFVLKTIKKFEEAYGAEQELLPEYRDGEDLVYAQTLLRRSIENADYYHSLIGGASRNWDLNRLAFMDILILQIALAEMLTFPEIPISVTINEYVELAKCYSTPRSHIYVNGILDHIAKTLQKEHKLFKN